MKKLLLLCSLMAASSLQAANQCEPVLTKLADAETLTRNLQQAGFGVLIEKTSIVENLANQCLSGRATEYWISRDISDYQKKNQEFDGATYRKLILAILQNSSNRAKAIKELKDLGRL